MYKIIAVFASIFAVGLIVFGTAYNPIMFTFPFVGCLSVIAWCIYRTVAKSTK